MRAQGKHQAALDAVAGPLGNVVTLPAERRRLRASLHGALGQHAEAAALLAEALLEEPEQWADVCQYMDCLLPHTAAGTGVAAPSEAGERERMFVDSVLILHTAGAVGGRVTVHGLPATAHGGGHRSCGTS